MELADVFEKIANNARLTPQELDFLKSSMRQTQMNNSFTAGLQNGKSSISAQNINAGVIRAQKETFLGLAARFVNSSVSVAHTTFTDVPSWTQDYNDGFLVSGSSITIPATGVYSITVGMEWDDVASGSGHRYFAVTVNGGYFFPADIRTPVSGGYTLMNAAREKDYNKGDVLKLNLLQTSGVTLTTNVAMAIRMLRSQV